MSTHGVLFVQTVVLVAVSLAVLYPVVAYARTLLYTDAVAMLSASLLVFTAGSLVEGGLGMVAASEGLYLLSALCFAVAVWLFAREFVRMGGGSFAVDDTSAGASSGFADSSGRRNETQTGAAGTERGFADATEGENVGGATEGKNGE